MICEVFFIILKFDELRSSIMILIWSLRVDDGLLDSMAIYMTNLSHGFI